MDDLAVSVQLRTEGGNTVSGRASRHALRVRVRYGRNRHSGGFSAADQLPRGLLPGEKAVWIVLFGVPLAVLATLGDNAGGTTFGGTPVCLFGAFVLFCVILRRALRQREEPAIST